MISFDGVPLDAWEPEALKQLVNSLDGELVEILLPTNKWFIKVTAWLEDPSSVPLEYEVEIPYKARHQLTQKHHVIIHVEEVTDPSNGITP